jgi:hypothetical protein
VNHSRLKAVFLHHNFDVVGRAALFGASSQETHKAKEKKRKSSLHMGVQSLGASKGYMGRRPRKGFLFLRFALFRASEHSKLI